MGIKRPSVKIPFWNPGFKNRPDVEPPGFLRIIAALCIVSIVGTTMYSVFSVTAGVGFTALAPQTAIYIAVLHFLLPISVAYTISTNSRLSRFLISIYFLILGGATVAGLGYLGDSSIDANVRVPLAITIVFLILVWLFGSSKSRYYYTLISGKDLPNDLVGRDSELAGHNWLSDQTNMAIEWIASHLETIVLIGFIIVVIFAFCFHRLTMSIGAIQLNRSIALKSFYGTVLVCLVGCSTMGKYESIAVGLTETDYVTDNFGYLKQWAPKGSNYGYTPSDVVKSRIESALSDWVRDLGKNVVGQPNISTATVKVLQCMESKSFILMMEEFVITG